MNQTKFSRPKKVLAASAAVLTAAAGMLISGAAAHAVPVPGPVTDEVGSITIHKQLNPGFDGDSQNPDGSGLDAGNPLGGATFEVCLIDGIDLLVGDTAIASVWDEVNALSLLAPSVLDSADAIGTYTLVCGPEQTTPSTGASLGVVEFDDLAVGAYLVRETAAPAIVVQRSAPFIVTVPTPGIDSAAGQWLYDVHVYPKNQALTDSEKEIVNQGAGTAIRGNNIDYRVTQVLPGVVGGVYSKFVMTDTLDPKLDPVASVDVTVDINGTPLLETGNFTANWAGRILTVTFLPDALALLKEDDEITIGFTAAANENGEIVNVANVDVNGLDGTGRNTPPVETRWGAVDLTKVNAVATAVPLGLGGAEFELWMGSIAGTGCAVATSGNELVTSGIVSGANGALGTLSGTTFTALPGLWVGDDSSPANNLDTRCYFLVETKAPAGFVLPATLAERTTEFIVHPFTTAHADATRVIENVQQQVPELPLTGGTMQTMLLISGGGLIATALVLLAVRRRSTGHKSAV